MAWPPPVLPINFQNQTASLDTHPEAHNDTNQVINLDIVPKINELAAAQLFAWKADNIGTPPVAEGVAYHIQNTTIINAPAGQWWVQGGLMGGMTTTIANSEIYVGVVDGTGQTLYRERYSNPTSSAKALPSLRVEGMVNHAGGNLALTVYVYILAGSGVIVSSDNEPAWIYARRVGS